MIGLLFGGMSDVVVEGNGTLFVFHGKMITFVFDEYQRMKLQHVRIDFARPTMSEMSFWTVTKDSIVRNGRPFPGRFTFFFFSSHGPIQAKDLFNCLYGSDPVTFPFGSSSYFSMLLVSYNWHYGLIA